MLVALEELKLGMGADSLQQHVGHTASQRAKLDDAAAIIAHTKMLREGKAPEKKSLLPKNLLFNILKGPPEEPETAK